MTQAGARQAALERAHPADGRSTSSFTRGQRLGTITLERLLARTAGHEIRLARDAAGSTLAAKCLRPGAGRVRAQALRREHAVLRGLRAPNIVAAAGSIETRTGPVVLLEYLGGGDLVSLRGFDARHWLEAARGVAAGLEHLHARGLAHRDVKARNVRFAADGRARLIDFGSAAELGAPATLAGTTAAHRRPGGASRRVTAADDVHAFAVLLHELMTGRLPHGVGPGSPLDESGRCARVVRPLGRSRPSGRFATALAHLAALVDAVLEPGGGERFDDVTVLGSAIGAALEAQSAAS